jgi:D-sedoheptulose 7-phosphate isomerase
MNEIQHIIDSSVQLKKQLADDKNLNETIQKIIHLIVSAFQSGNKVLFCGNGGSAADAQHLAAEFSGRFYINRDALPAEALHCNTSYLTAVANDYSYDEIYSRLIQGIGKPGDILIGLTTSGNSKNICRAFETAKEKNIITIAFTAAGIRHHHNVIDRAASAHAATSVHSGFSIRQCFPVWRACRSTSI